MYLAWKEKRKEDHYWITAFAETVELEVRLTSLQSQCIQQQSFPQLCIQSHTIRDSKSTQTKTKQSSSSIWCQWRQWYVNRHTNCPHECVQCLYLILMRQTTQKTECMLRVCGIEKGGGCMLVTIMWLVSLQLRSWVWNLQVLLAFSCAPFLCL